MIPGMAGTILTEALGGGWSRREEKGGSFAWPNLME